MRRIGAVLAALAMLIPLPSTAAPGVKLQQRADAMWLIPTQKEGRFVAYYAAATLDEMADGPYARDDASFGKGRCRREESDGGTMTTCSFIALAHGKASETFTMDPLMQFAELNLSRKGRTYRVGWVGGEPGYYQSWEGCMSSEDEEPKEGQGGGAIRLAGAETDHNGQHLVTEDFDAVLRTGAMVTECMRSDELATLRPGETRRITFRD